MTNSWGIIGCAYMSREYCKALLAKGVTPKIFSRDLASANVKSFCDAFPELSVQALPLTGEEVDNWLVCTNIESHEEICAGLKGNIYCEKPYAHLPDYEDSRDILILLNRRYYYWVEFVKALIDSGSITKVIACIPERSIDALITQSIHVIDMLWYLAGPFQPAVKIGSSMPSYALMTDRGLPMLINMNYGANENFSLRFYAENGYVYEAKPLEFFCTAVGMEVKEPDDENPLRSYRPMVESRVYAPTQLKPGVGELVDDLLAGGATRLPRLSEHRRIHVWMQENMA